MAARALIPRDANTTQAPPETAREPAPAAVDTAAGPDPAAEAGPAAAGVDVPPPQPWPGWPSTWPTPSWWGAVETATDIAWACLDLTSSVVAAMPPYLVGAAPSLNADWLNNPDPDRYNCWEEFLRQLFWDFQACGEAIIVTTAPYATGWPARFHLIPPTLVDIELDGDGIRQYTVGGRHVDRRDVCHIRYQATTQSTHGTGPLAVGRTRIVAANLLTRYLSNLLATGAVPPTALVHPQQLTAEQSTELQQQWIAARMSAYGLPAVLSGGVTYTQLTYSPKDLALVDLASMTEARIAVLLRVPAYLVGLPQSSDSLVYNTAALTLDYHWRAHLRPMVRQVVAALSNWALPAGTVLELNRDDYVKPGPLELAQYYATMHGIVDPDAGPAMTVPEIREMNRFSTAAPTGTTTSGVLQ